MPQTERAPAIATTGVSNVDQKLSGRNSRSLQLEDPDFSAEFVNGQWTVSWRWSDKSTEGLQTRLSEYKCTQALHVREHYCAELESWISKGWLKRWDEPGKGSIPLLAVFQPTKDKVRPVMDYHELNNFNECHTGDDMDTECGEKVRKKEAVTG